MFRCYCFWDYGVAVSQKSNSSITTNEFSGSGGIARHFDGVVAGQHRSTRVFEDSEGVWVYHEALLEQGPCFEECPMVAGPCCYVCELHVQRGGPSALSYSCVLDQVYRLLQYPKP